MKNWRQILSWNTTETGDTIALSTKDAYSFSRYGLDLWIKVADLLLSFKLTPEQVEEILRSKWMRYLGDQIDLIEAPITPDEIDRVFSEIKNSFVKNKKYLIRDARNWADGTTNVWNTRSKAYTRD